MTGERATTGDGTAQSYVLIGKQDLNNGLVGGFELPAFVYARTSDAGGEPFPEADAATLRAAIMSDFGIDTWDGSTYPT